MPAKAKVLVRDIFVPREPFTAFVDGHDKVFTTDIRVREGHPILEKYGHLFERIRVHYDVEEATDRPGEPRA